MKIQTTLLILLVVAVLYATLLWEFAGPAAFK